MNGQLPALFSELQVYVDDGWALATQQERNDKRCSSSMDELNSFYTALIARIEEIAAYLNQYSLECIPQDAARLLQLGQMLMEVAPAVEVMKSPDIPTDFERSRLIIHAQKQNYIVGN